MVEPVDRNALGRAKTYPRQPKAKMDCEGEGRLVSSAKSPAGELPASCICAERSVREVTKTGSLIRQLI